MVDKALMNEAKKMLKDRTPAAIAEQLATQLKTAREARGKIDRDGIVVADSRGNPVEHPAIAIEAKSQTAVARILRVHAKR